MSTGGSHAGGSTAAAGATSAGGSQGTGGASGGTSASSNGVASTGPASTGGSTQPPSTGGSTHHRWKRRLHVHRQLGGSAQSSQRRWIDGLRRLRVERRWWRDELGDDQHRSARSRDGGVTGSGGSTASGGTTAAMARRPGRRAARAAAAKWRHDRVRRHDCKGRHDQRKARHDRDRRKRDRRKHRHAAGGQGLQPMPLPLRHDRFDGEENGASMIAQFDFFTPGWMMGTFNQGYVCTESAPGGALAGLVPVDVTYIAANYVKNQHTSCATATSAAAAVAICATTARSTSPRTGQRSFPSTRATQPVLRLAWADAPSSSRWSRIGTSTTPVVRPRLGRQHKQGPT